MKTQTKLYQSILGLLLVTLLILMVPWVAMFFNYGVDWSPFDFILAGVLLFSTGLAFILVTRQAANIIYRIAIGLALATTLFMIWANLAVGLISAGPNPGNFMYIGVLAVAIVGSFRSGFKPAGMERAMYNTAIALLLVAVIALLAGMHNYPQSSVIEILGVNVFFATPYGLAGLLFRHVAREESATT